MPKKRANKISTIGSQITTVISVALVLLIVGIIFIISLLTSGAGDTLRQHVAVVVRLEDGVSDDNVKALSDLLNNAEYTASLKYNSAEDILKEESDENGDILELLGENPYTPEFELYLKPDYVNADSISAISAQLTPRAEVAEVYSQIDVIDSVNNFLRHATLVLSGIGVVFLFISIVLLVNTMSLVVYSRRFVIHTMQLVGATRGFIRKPFVLTGVWLGLVSGLFASLMLCGLYYYTIYAHVDSMLFIGWGPTALVCLSLVVIGMVLCGTASFFAANRFISSSYDDLFK